MGKLNNMQLKELSDKLKVTAKILSEEENVYSLLDFEASFNLPYNLVGSCIRNSYLKKAIGITEEEKQVLSMFFSKRNISYVRLTDEKMENSSFNYEFIIDDQIVEVDHENCKKVYNYLKEEGVNATISAFDCAVKRYAFNEKILPYKDAYKNVKTR